MIAIDTETALIVPGNLTPALTCVSLASGVKERLLDHVDGPKHVEALLDAGTELVFHNAPFDLAVLANERPSLLPKIFSALEAGRIHDTYVRQQLIDIATGNLRFFTDADGEVVRTSYSLKELAYRHLKIELSKDAAVRLNYGQLRGVPIAQWEPQFREYALKDAATTRAVALAQEGGPNLHDEAAQMRAFCALHLMSVEGIRTDPHRVASLKEQLTRDVGAAREGLIAAGFYRECKHKRCGDGRVCQIARAKGKTPELSKDMALIKARVEAAYRGNPPVTDSGAVSTSADTLERSGDPLLKQLADIGGLDKLLTTYVPILEQGTSVPINARFNPLVASGRTSCSRPNLQNQPRMGGVRECYVPRAEHVFVSVDYDTLELRALAQCLLWLFGESKMADALRAEKDLHLAVAAQLLKDSYESLSTRKSAPDVKAARQFAKIANFGFPGGLGAATLVEFARTSYGTKMTEHAARELKAEFLSAWPEMARYFEYIGRKVGDARADITQFYSQRVRGNCGYCDASNTLFQGLAADGAKAAAWAVAQACYTQAASPLFGCRPVAFIHDEILMEVPEARAHEAAVELSRVMCAAMQRVIPDVPITASPALMRRWWKDAEDVYDSNERLICWEPEAKAA